MPKIEITPDSTNESLEQSEEKVTKDGVDTNKDITVNADATSATVTEKEVQETPIEESVRPSWLPQKFKDAEELAKAYGELEKQFSSRTQEEVEPEPNQQDARKFAEQGMALETYYDEFAKEGALSTKSYKALEKNHGLSKELVDGYIEGQKAIGDAHTQAVHDTVGGKDSYAELIDWAGKNLSEQEQSAFNKMVDNGSIDEAKFAVSGLMMKAGKNFNPKQPELFEGTSDVTPKDNFESVRQVTDAMQDARYDKDPAYRKKVTDKLARSTVI